MSKFHVNNELQRKSFTTYDYVMNDLDILIVDYSSIIWAIYHTMCAEAIIQYLYRVNTKYLLLANFMDC